MREKGAGRGVCTCAVLKDVNAFFLKKKSLAFKISISETLFSIF